MDYFYSLELSYTLEGRQQIFKTYGIYKETVVNTPKEDMLADMVTILKNKICSENGINPWSTDVFVHSFNQI